jgi:hypothetical protein
LIQIYLPYEMKAKIPFVIASMSLVLLVFSNNIDQSVSAIGLNTDLQSIIIAQKVYESQSISLPKTVGTFVWYIVNEAHEDTHKEPQKLISNHNPNFIPTKLTILEGVSILFLDTDAPWDTPHPHTIEITDNSSDKVVYSTGKLDYTDNSKPVILPAGKYVAVDTAYPWMKGTISVLPNPEKNTANNLTVGAFLAPTNQVADKKDNDGGIHPGWLGYYKTELTKNGFKILSEFDFHYAVCSYCPGKFWPDQKTGDHTLIIYSTNQGIDSSLQKLAKMVRDNVYI